MTEEELREEYTKCLESPAYFYNNYCVVVDKNSGAVSKPNPITDEQVEVIKLLAQAQRNLRQPFGSGKLPEYVEKLLEKYKAACE